MEEEISFIPRLCGPVLFNVLLSFRRDRATARQRRDEAIIDGLSDQDLLAGLIRIGRLSFKPLADSSFKTDTSNYKKCKGDEYASIPITTEVYISTFNEEFKNNYQALLKRTNQVLTDYVIPDLEARVLLGKRLLKMLYLDDSIKDDEVLYVLKGGEGVAKKELFGKNRIYLQNLILGLWHYILNNRKKGTVGKETVKLISSCDFRYDAVLDSIMFDETTDIEVGVISLNENDVQFDSNFVNNDSSNPTYYSRYLSKLKNKFSMVKTFLYSDTPRRFSDFYVCNDIGFPMRDGFLDFDFEYEHFRGPRLENATAPKLVQTISNHILITGTGGLGKSMMMRNLLLDSIQNYSRYNLLPVFITLKDFDDKYETLFDLLVANIKQHAPKVSKDEIMKTLIEGNALILLDGLDEIKSKYLPAFNKQLEALTDMYSANTFIISSRPYSSFASMERFSVVRLRPFTKAQALELITRLEFRPDEPSIKEKFRDLLDKKLFQTHKEFTANPLLLTIMLMTFEQYAEIPSKMHVFYREAYQALSQKHDANKGAFKRALKTGLSADRFNDYFSEFCSRTYVDEKFELTREEFVNYFESLHEVERHPEEHVSASDFLEDLCSNVCLLFKDGNKYFFTHRSFQEYFCAQYFSKQKDKNLEQIGHFFEDAIVKHRNMSNDKTFSMLNDMIPDKVAEYIFLPFLTALFKKCDKSTHPYLTYLDSLYKQLNLVHCDYDLKNMPLPGALNHAIGFVIPFIRRDVLKLPVGKNIQIPLFEELVNDKILIIGSSEEIRNEESMIRLLEEHKFKRCIPFADEFGIDVPKNGVEASTMSVKIKRLIEDPEKYRSLISVISDSTFQLKIEYDSLRQYYRKLANQSSRKKSKSMFDNF